MFLLKYYGNYYLNIKMYERFLEIIYLSTSVMGKFYWRSYEAPKAVSH